MTAAETNVTGAPSAKEEPTVHLPTPTVQGTVHINNAKPAQRITLDRHKAYLDTCASHHSFFAEEYVRNIHESKCTMNTSCNAGEISTNTQGYYEEFLVWLQEQGIANLILLPELETMGYKVNYNTDREWVVKFPKGKITVFKHDTGLCKGMPYIQLDWLWIRYWA